MEMGAPCGGRRKTGDGGRGRDGDGGALRGQAEDGGLPLRPSVRTGAPPLGRGGLDGGRSRAVGAWYAPGRKEGRRFCLRGAGHRFLREGFSCIRFFAKADSGQVCVRELFYSQPFCASPWFRGCRGASGTGWSGLPGGRGCSAPFFSWKPGCGSTRTTELSGQTEDHLIRHPASVRRRMPPSPQGEGFGRIETGNALS